MSVCQQCDISLDRECDEPGTCFCSKECKNIYFG